MPSTARKIRGCSINFNGVRYCWFIIAHFYQYHRWANNGRWIYHLDDQTRILRRKLKQATYVMPYNYQATIITFINYIHRSFHFLLKKCIMCFCLLKKCCQKQKSKAIQTLKLLFLLPLGWSEIRQISLPRGKKGYS